MTGLWITLAVIGGILLLIGLYVIATYNSLVGKRTKVEEAFSTMDISMKKRYDLVPNLVSTVKGYTKHENETLTNVINARNNAYNATTIDEKKKAEGELTQSLKSLFALAESYPDLKANSNFLNLQAQLEKIEQEIANSRRFYNACVYDLNTLIERFPSNLVAKRFKFNKHNMFELDSPEERKNVKVEF